ncbi:MAG: DUF2318 domain-containing protein [Deltaproteobacteria bacterium]|nr:DUF2318 domain-containing protein [Deltaproteobacteria bacterium]
MLRVFSSSVFATLAVSALLLTGCEEQGLDAPSACDDDPCDVNATCSDLGAGEYDCTCNEGFAGDGETCSSDGDGDGVADDVDNCPEDANPDQVDEDDNGVGDDCEEEADPVVIPLSDITTTAQFYTWETTINPSTTVHYFAVLGSDGDPHVAFDACDVCFADKMGYSQVDEEMQCNKCGNLYAINGIGTENTGTGCWPGYLSITITETDVIIQPDDLNGGDWYWQ